MPITTQDIRKEVEDGLKNERERLDAARINLHFYQGNFTDCPVRPNSRVYSGAW